MGSSTTIAVRRHPEVPSPTPRQVLASGFQFVDEGQIVGAAEVDARIRRETRDRTGGLLPGAGWLLPFRAGFLYLSFAKVFMFKKAVHLTGMCSAVPDIPLDQFEAELLRRVDNLTQEDGFIPLVDIVEMTTEVLDGPFGLPLGRSSRCRIVVQGQDGTRTEYSFRSVPAAFGGAAGITFRRRYEREFEALAYAIVSEALGGEAFVEQTRGELASQGVRLFPTTGEVNLGVLTDWTGSRPRSLDGPEQSLKRLEEAVAEALARQGYQQATALAKLYVYDLALDDFMEAWSVDKVWSRAIRDRKFASELLERWSEAHDDFLAAADEMTSVIPERLVKAARGELADA